MLLASIILWVSVQVPPVLPPGRADWTLLAGGDIMLNGVSFKTKVFDSLTKLKIPRDVFYANLEIPLTNSKARTSAKSAAEIKAKSQFVLKADPRHILHLKNFGLNVVSLGNNHALDYGSGGLEEEMRLLKKWKIGFTGAGMKRFLATRPAVVRTKNRIRVAFLSYLSFLNPSAMAKCTPATQSSPGVATLTLGGKSGEEELRFLSKIVTSVKANADFLVITPHWGTERQPIPRDYQVALGRLWIDAGADCVIGNHPHVLQPAEVYKGKPIIYSLGNLVGPSAGRTGLYSLRFRGWKLLSAKFIGLSYASGVVKPAPADSKAMMKAEEMLLSKFPSTDSFGLLTKHSLPSAK